MTCMRVTANNKIQMVNINFRFCFIGETLLIIEKIVERWYKRLQKIIITLTRTTAV